jgi:ClpX C4-type zinc finger protein
VTLSHDLLEKARAAQTGLAEAERRVLLARAEYHTAIRRLHLAGGPLREIAGALSLSHQRVQQIVNATGGSWWRRVWRTRNPRRDAACTWCDRPPSEVSKLVAGPNVYICDGCVDLADRALSGAGGGPGALELATEGATNRCSFCRRRRNGRRSVVTGPAANICSECLRICRELMDGRAA